MLLECEMDQRTSGAFSLADSTIAARGRAGVKVKAAINSKHLTRI